MAWDRRGARVERYASRNFSRPLFLALLRDAAALVGNSSSGIIEAATFGTPVLDIGPRQTGRERSGNVVHVPCRSAPIKDELRGIWNSGDPRRWKGANVYGAGAPAAGSRRF